MSGYGEHIMKKHFNEDEMKAVKTVANKHAYKWKAVNKEDLQQHLYLFLTRKYDTLERWRTEEYGEAKMYLSLNREANNYCVKEQAEANGEKTLSTNKITKNTYTFNQIAKALDYLWEYPTSILSSTTTHPTDDNIIIHNSETQKLLDIMLDIKKAITQLNPSDQIIIEYRYKENKTFKQIAELLNIKEDAARMRINRLINKLQNLIG
jgi:RNA polymerase sigma factor (sigma-70 family)